jgi:hypothetical protein
MSEVSFLVVVFEPGNSDRVDEYDELSIPLDTE